MSRFAIRYPYLIVVICLITCVVGVTSLVRMPVDLFPPIKIPVVVVATFAAGRESDQSLFPARVQLGLGCDQHRQSGNG